MCTRPDEASPGSFKHTLSQKRIKLKEDRLAFHFPQGNAIHASKKHSYPAQLPDSFRGICGPHQSGSFVPMQSSQPSSHLGPWAMPISAVQMDTRLFGNTLACQRTLVPDANTGPPPTCKADWIQFCLCALRLVFFSRLELVLLTGAQPHSPMEERLSSLRCRPPCQSLHLHPPG